MNMWEKERQNVEDILRSLTYYQQQNISNISSTNSLCAAVQALIYLWAPYSKQFYVWQCTRKKDTMLDLAIADFGEGV